jgi:hypothetical protein
MSGATQAGTSSQAAAPAAPPLVITVKNVTFLHNMYSKGKGKEVKRYLDHWLKEWAANEGLHAAASIEVQ